MSGSSYQVQALKIGSWKAFEAGRAKIGKAATSTSGCFHFSQLPNNYPITTQYPKNWMGNGYLNSTNYPIKTQDGKYHYPNNTQAKPIGHRTLMSSARSLASTHALTDSRRFFSESQSSHSETANSTSAEDKLLKTLYPHRFNKENCKPNQKLKEDCP